MTASLVDFFVQSRAERTARAYSAHQRAGVRACFDAAECRLRAGRRVVPPVPAAVLLREAVVYYLLAAQVGKGGVAADETLSWPTLASEMAVLAPDPARPVVDPTDDARVRAALATRESLYFDRLSPEDAAATRWALDRAASMLRGRVEARSLANIRATRWGRVAALGIVLGYAALEAIRAAVVMPNVALHKPVSPSSVAHVPADGQSLVDGETGTSFGVHTQVEDSPRVVIDLLDTYRIRRLKVHNRVDGWFDDCLPLVAELSEDGRSYKEIARRDTHFGGDPPWVIDANDEPARYVRLRIPRKGYLALSEVEVFGRRK
jgi:hypothetical protein